MKQLLVAVLSTLALAQSSPSFAAPGAIVSSVPDEYLVAIARDVAQWHNKKHAKCKAVRVTAAEVIRTDTDSTVTEHWTVEACDAKSFTYQVTILPSESGVSDLVSDLDDPATPPSQP